MDAVVINSEPRWLGTARQELGQTEILGSQHNPRILEYLHTTGAWWTTDETPWCSAFCNWVMIQSGIEGTNSATALSWRNWQGSVTLDRPALGAIAVKTRIRSKGPIGSLASLPRVKRLKLFKEALANGPSPTNPDNAIKIINRTLNRIENVHSLPSNRMFGILDDKFVTRHSGGNVTALTKGHRIEIQSNGSFSIYNRKTGGLFLTK